MSETRDLPGTGDRSNERTKPHLWDGSRLRCHQSHGHRNRTTRSHLEDRIAISFLRGIESQCKWSLRIWTLTFLNLYDHQTGRVIPYLTEPTLLLPLPRGIKLVWVSLTSKTLRLISPSTPPPCAPPLPGTELRCLRTIRMTQNYTKELIYKEINDIRRPVKGLWKLLNNFFTKKFFIDNCQKEKKTLPQNVTTVRPHFTDKCPR